MRGPPSPQIVHIEHSKRGTDPKASLVPPGAAPSASVMARSSVILKTGSTLQFILSKGARMQADDLSPIITFEGALSTLKKHRLGLLHEDSTKPIRDRGHTGTRFGGYSCPTTSSLVLLNCLHRLSTPGDGVCNQHHAIWIKNVTQQKH
jgi:hypothetical protein